MSAPDRPDRVPGSTPPVHVRLMDRIGNIWFGVTMLVIIFVYSSIGSALPPVRQGILADWLGLEFLRFEKTEMQWFSWWPFQVMIALFCLALILVTVRKIRLNLINAGVWAIHTGIIILAVSSVIYFGRKIEGDMPVFQGRALILAPGMREPASMVVRPDASATVGEGGNAYHIHVDEIDPGFVIPDGEHQGERTQAIWLNVSAPSRGQTFMRRLLLGYPQHTRDRTFGAGGPMWADERNPGQVLADEGLQIQLDYDPVEYFYLADTTAIYARLSPDQEWTQFRVHGMPHYYEHLSRREGVWAAPSESLPSLRPLDLPAIKPPDAPHLEGIQCRITDFLPYAQWQTRWVAGGGMLNPLIRLSVETAQGRESGDLLAADSTQRPWRPAGGPAFEFRWASSPAQRATLTEVPKPQVVVRVASKNVEQAVDLADLQGTEPVAIEGTDYRIALREVVPEGILKTTGSPGLILIRVTKGDTSFDRMVVAGHTDGGWDLDESMRPLFKAADPDLRLEYQGTVGDRVLLVAGPAEGAVDVILTRLGEVLRRETATVGQAVRLNDDLEVRIDSLIRDARQEQRPTIVPVVQRQSRQQVGRNRAFVRVEVQDGHGAQTAWLPYHDYAFRDAQRAVPRRFLHQPTRVTLTDGRVLELLYSRWREPLPAPVALDRFILKTYPGGDQPSDYISWLRFWEDGQWSPICVVRSNQPARHGDYWYFQSYWDPAAQSHTGLGVGNREAVHGMLGGVCLSIAGMIYAFYVKPGLIRRRKERFAIQARQRRQVDEPAEPEGPTISDEKPEVELV